LGRGVRSITRSLTGTEKAQVGFTRAHSGRALGIFSDGKSARIVPMISCPVLSPGVARGRFRLLAGMAPGANHLRRVAGDTRAFADRRNEERELRV